MTAEDMTAKKANRFQCYRWKNVSGKDDEGKEMQFTANRNSEFDTSRSSLLAPPKTGFGTADCPREKKKNENSYRKKDDEYR